MKKEWWLLALVLVPMACGDEVSPLDADPGYAYYPIDPGVYRTYQVEKITFIGGVADTLSYFLKEVMGQPVTETSATHFLYRYITADTTVAWKLDSVWSTRRTAHHAVVTENNIPFVKLTFPVKAGATWDGNALNSRPPSEYRTAPVVQWTNGHLALGPAGIVRVIMADIPENLVNRDEKSEVYAEGIGLIEKDYITLNFCTANCGELGEVQSGRILRQVLIQYGEE